ncbi:hypothetical protein H7J86_27210 [Mycobacterium hackensackense]|uniref:hypothetical protein n=1 Tax=Mycobacterium hackensackense TaxID=228909 RepID=UPI002265BE67|nr:hypothetical protein [Mycobacterium hackensackense]MCV7255862.1 hypothetical protein [Mycobacterium hackensackense]
MTRTDWNVSIYAGAAWGGVFWMALPVFTSLLRSNPPPHAALVTVAVSIAVSLAGLVFFRAAQNPTTRRIGAAITIGALLGLPVLAWLALWQSVIP